MGGMNVQKRDLYLIGGVILLAVVLGVSIFLSESIETGSWGLSFRIEGQPPVGSASASVLRGFDTAYIGNPQEKVLYLTFDAGYENGCTEQILDVLKKHEVPAAFFLVGNYMEKNADLVRRMVQEGHIVGNHTMHHPDMSKISDFSAFQKELEDLEKLYTDITGQQMPKFYRPPQGTYSEENLRMAHKLGYKTVFWSLAYVDWNNDSQPTREQAFDTLLPRTHNGAVVLLHSTSRTNGEILDELLTNWEAEGYRFESINKLFS